MIRHAMLLVFVCASAACLSAFAPGIQAREHHASVGPRDPDATCMGCHESESSMYERMQRMAPKNRQRHMRAEHHVGMAPLVQDWMLEDSRGCLSCHRLRGLR